MVLITYAQHPRIVQLFDTFALQNDGAFCTVLQRCDGGDLDSLLKAHKTLPEREARCIISQVIHPLHCAVRWALVSSNTCTCAGVFGSEALGV